MKLEELLENFKSQESELTKAIAEWTQHLDILKERLLRVSGAAEGIQIVIDNQDAPEVEDEETEVSETEVLPGQHQVPGESSISLRSLYEPGAPASEQDQGKRHQRNISH